MSTATNQEFDLLTVVAQHAAARPDHVAHRWRDEQVTWSELE